MKNKINLYYDEEGDLLELRMGKAEPSYYEEIEDGIFERRDEKTHELKGFTIFNFKKRSIKVKNMQAQLSKTIEV